MATDTPNRTRIAVLVSGSSRGTNLQALMDACRHPDYPAEICVVVGTRRESQAMQRAIEHGIQTQVISPRSLEEDAYGKALITTLQTANVELICLAGYMLKLPLQVVHQYTNRIMNIHPGLLPFFGGSGMYGIHVHEAVIASGMKVSGCTVHFVDEEYDTGPIVIQRTVPVESEDTPAELAARLLPIEHEAYVDAVRLFAQGRLIVSDGRVTALPSAESQQHTGIIVSKSQ